MKKIMILGASILQLPAIKTAKEMGLDVVAVDMNPQAVGFSVEGVIKETISTIDTPRILEAARKHQIDGIMTLASDMPMQSVAKVCHELGLVGISEDTALKTTNKGFMRDALKSNGVPIPLYYKVTNEIALSDAVHKINEKGYRCIVKPADNSGSRGVVLIKSCSDLSRIYDYSTAFSRTGELVVEEYMEGPEVSVETLAIGGHIYVIQITDKLTTGAPYFVETGHSQPSQLANSIQDKIREVAIAANKAVGIENGPSHTEIKITNEGPKVVELGARLGGDNITTHLTPISTGIDMVKATIQIAIGEKPDVAVRSYNGSAIRFLLHTGGTIEEITGIKEAKQTIGVETIELMHDVGDVIDEIKSSNDRVGFVIARGENASMAIDAAEEACSKIRVFCRGER